MAGQRRVLMGKVVSDRMDKTVVVSVERLVAHPRYRRTIRRRTRFKAHDPHNACRAGDQVAIAETRPLSKDKRWRVVKIVHRPLTAGSRKPEAQEADATP